MVREITGAGYRRPGRLQRSDKGRVRKGDKAQDGSSTERETGPDVLDEVPGELQALIERVREGEAVRLERVHDVLDKMKRGELITSEAVREAAERILDGGT